MTTDKFKIYHTYFTEVVQEIIKYVQTKNLNISEDDIYNQITIGDKPKTNKNIKYNLQLTKNNKLINKYIHVQVFKKVTGTHELNMYIS